MRISKLAATFFTAAVMATSFSTATISSTPFLANASLTSSSKTAGDTIWEYGDCQYGTNLCPIAGLYKTDDSKVLITPSGDVYMQKYLMSPSCDSPYTGRTKVMLVQNSKYDDYYEFYFDESNYKKFKGTDSETDKLMKDYITIGERLFFNKKKRSFGEQLNGFSSFLSGTVVFEGVADYSHGEYFGFAPGNIVNNNINTDSPDITDLTTLQLYCLGELNGETSKYVEINNYRYYLSMINADLNFDGKVNHADLATLKQIIAKVKTVDQILNQEFGV